jgi:carboxymethylenebutenolidase
MKNPMKPPADSSDAPLGRSGADVEFPAAGDSGSGYLAVPAAGHGRGVLVIHEDWGLVGHSRDVCDRLAREGFLALAPDLYRGSIAEDERHAGELAAALDPAGTGDLLAAAAAALVNDSRCDGRALGALGFGMGGVLALFAASRIERIGAVVDFYGHLPGWRLDLSHLAASVLGIFAEHDALVSADDVKRLEVSLSARGAGQSLRVQPGVHHGFMNDARPGCYDPAAAAAGWDAILAFLRAELS